MTVPLKQYTPEEIEFFLEGERREVDRLLLHGLNGIVCVLVPHIQKEEKREEAHGTVEEIIARNVWLKNRMAREEKWDKMRTKVIESAALWAVPIICAFALAIFSDGLRQWVSTWLSDGAASVRGHK